MKLVRYAQGQGRDKEWRYFVNDEEISPTRWDLLRAHGTLFPDKLLKGSTAGSVLHTGTAMVPDYI